MVIGQVAELLLETFGAPDWVFKTMPMLLMIGFPFALFFAWAFELTPDGIKEGKDVDRSQSITKQTGRKLDFTIIAILALALEAQGKSDAEAEADYRESTRWVDVWLNSSRF